MAAPALPDAGFAGWAPAEGYWELDGRARFVPPAEGPAGTVGLLLSPHAASEGAVRVGVTFEDGAEELPQARVVFGYAPDTQNHYSAGLGGYESLYVVEEYRAGAGFIPVRRFGNPENLRRGITYDLEVLLLGQRVVLVVNGTEVLEAPVGRLDGLQFGLTAWGRSPVIFERFEIDKRDPNAFVVMQFGEPYDTLYQEVIAPVAHELGYEVTRADDVYGPGTILEDIIEAIRDASVVVAEVTPANPNVFYELGYAHATGKPAILLAARGQRLPFDVSGYRCIFYDDTIGGKQRVEHELRRHLTAVSQH